MAAEITRTSLQSLVQVHFDAFCYVPSATHDCDLHTWDAFPDMLSDTRGQNVYPAIAYCGTSVICNTLDFYLLLPYWLYIDEHFDMPWTSKTSVS